MFHYNRFDLFHDFFFHSSNCKQYFLSFVINVEDEVNTQLKQSIFKLHSIFVVHEWLDYLDCRFFKCNIVTFHVDVFEIVNVFFPKVEFVNVKGWVALPWDKHFWRMFKVVIVYTLRRIVDEFDLVMKKFIFEYASKYLTMLNMWK